MDGPNTVLSLNLKFKRSRGYAGGVRKYKPILLVMGLVWGVFLCLPIHGENWVISPISGAQDILLLNDVTGPPSSQNISNAVGDFDGDGVADFVPSVENIYGARSWLFVFKGPSWKNNDRFSDQVDMVLSLFVEEFTLLDMTGDKKDELILRCSTAIYVFQGRTEIPPSLNLADADLQIVGPSRPIDLVGGDLDGDGRGDLIIGYGISTAPARTEWHVIQGPPSFPVKTIDSSVSAVKKIIGPPSSNSKMDVGDLDEDGWNDLVLSGPDLTPPEVDVLFGKSDFPATWDLRTTSADVQIFVSSYSIETGEFIAMPCGDLNGDHRSELLLSFLVSGTLYETFLLEGSLLTPGRRMSGDPDDPDYVPPHPVFAGRSSRTQSKGDFDGDGRTDLLLGENLLLASDISPGPITEITSPSLQFTMPIGNKTPVLGDLNNDEYDDIAFYSGFNDIPNIYGGIFIVYGHRLLRNPSVDIRPRAVPSPHVALTLAVGGDPVDMMIYGDITDSFRDQWIPYATTLDVTLSSDEGSKSVKAKFRNAVGRVSAEAEDSWTLAAPTSQVVPLTNWVGETVRAQFDCHLPDPGRVRAWVLDPKGVEIKNLFDGDQPAGIVTLEWDGTNGAGRKVAPGIYFVVIDSHGRSQHRVIVEP